MNFIALLSTACLLAALGVAVWGMDAKTRLRYAAAQHVEHLLKLREDSPGDLIATNVLERDSMGGAPWGPLWMRHAATWRQVCWVLVAATVLAVPVLALGWVRTGLLVWGVIVLVGVGWARRRWQKLREQVRQQLPAFIDNMVRMVVLGHAVQSAFLFSASTAKMPLKATLNQAAAFAKAGMPVDQALNTASRHWDLNEFALLTSIMQVGSRFGGRIDSLLERVAHFMRDREQAALELHALSAEVRLSSWVLSLLPLLIAGMIITTNANYFLQMWGDPAGRNLLYIAAGLQVTGVTMLYRLAQLD